VFFGVITFNCFSQQGTKWSVGGNAVNSGEFFGTTNAMSIVFKTNGSAHMWLSPTGNLGLGVATPTNKFEVQGASKLDGNIEVTGQSHLIGFTLIDSNLTVLQNITSNNVKVISLANNGIKLVAADATGTLTPFAFGLANQVLYGNGVWGTLPAPPQTYWTQSGNNIYYNSGTVGVGTNTPSSLYKLDVIGDARISGTVLTSHVLISSRVQTDTSASAVTVIGTPQTPPTANIKLFVEGDTKINGSFTSSSATVDSLHIINKIKVGNSIYIDGVGNTNTTNNIYTTFPALPGENGDLFIQSVQNMSACPVNNTIINYNNNGKVGIGTIPSIDAGIKLHVKGFTCTGTLCSSCGSGTQPAGESTIFRLEDAVTGDITRTAWWDFVASGYNHKLFIKTKSSDGINAYVMTMAENGKVGIGSTEPTYHLQVESSLDNQFQVIGKGTGFGGTLLANIYTERNSEGVGNALLKVGTAFNPNTLYVLTNGKHYLLIIN